MPLSCRTATCSTIRREASPVAETTTIVGPADAARSVSGVPEALASMVEMVPITSAGRSRSRRMSASRAAISSLLATTSTPVRVPRRAAVPTVQLLRTLQGTSASQVPNTTNRGSTVLAMNSPMIEMAAAASAPATTARPAAASRLRGSSGRPTA